MPVWQHGNCDLYWVLLPGSYDFDNSSLKSSAFIAVVEITPDCKERNGCRTKVLDSLKLHHQWVNNTMAVSDQGVFVVTNACDHSGACTSGYLHSIGLCSCAVLDPLWFALPMKFLQLLLCLTIVTLASSSGYRNSCFQHVQAFQLACMLINVYNRAKTGAQGF